MGLLLICNIYFLLQFDGLCEGKSGVEEGETADKQRYPREWRSTNPARLRCCR